MLEHMHRFISTVVAAVVFTAAVGLWPAPGHAQGKDFDFYASFRTWLRELPPPMRRQDDEVVRLYREKLTKDGVEPAEVERRATLVRTRRNDLEADYWNRFFTSPNPGFNTEPNAFLVSVAEKRKPGRALDVGMGEGRNTLYLAKLGWDVTGFDPAEKAVALAQERAKKLGLKIKTETVLDTDFDFGKEQWDLILYSWVAPVRSAARAIDGLKPGGVIVVESSTALMPNKDILLQWFKPLRVLQHTQEPGKSDFFSRQDQDIIRFLAEKPRQ
jgi:2-polyprenyl-3-methyl-5-hydroxy-6-metoxy-1,4-benzoquinol methylase